jgi:hypothetical protein
MLLKHKKGNILTETVIFVILNITFFAVMLLFIYLQSSPVHIAEEGVAKQVALLIDASKPGSEIKINLKDFFEESEIRDDKAIVIDHDRNVVVAKGSDDSFFEYSYFNDVDVSPNVVEGWLELKIDVKGGEDVE